MATSAAIAPVQPQITLFLQDSGKQPRNSVRWTQIHVLMLSEPHAQCKRNFTGIGVRVKRQASKL